MERTPGVEPGSSAWKANFSRSIRKNCWDGWTARFPPRLGDGFGGSTSSYSEIPKNCLPLPAITSRALASSVRRPWSLGGPKLSGL